MSKRLPSIKTLEDKTWALCKEYVYKRDKMICQWCGKYVSKSPQPSHVIPKSRSKYLRYDDTNIKLLCFGCHIPRWHKEPKKAWEWFSSKFPERVKYLDDNENIKLKDYLAKTGQTYREWLNEWIWYYEDKLDK